MGEALHVGYAHPMWWPQRPDTHSALRNLGSVGEFVAAVKVSALPELEDFLAGRLKEALTAASGVAAVVLPHVGEILLKALVAALTEPETNPVLTQVEVLRSAPCRRATLQLIEATSFVARSNQQIAFQQQRLRAALESLDEAESLASQGEMIAIVFMKAITAALMIGGQPAALGYCRRFNELLEMELSTLSTELEFNEQRLQQHIVRLNAIAPPDRPRGGGGLVGWDAAAAPLKRSALEMRIAARRRYGNELKQAESSMKWSGDAITLLRNELTDSASSNA